MRTLLLLFLVSFSLFSKELPRHWVCGPYKANTGNPIFRVHLLERSEDLQLIFEDDWKQNFGTLPKGKYLSPSQPTSSGKSRYLRMEVSRFFPHPSKPNLKSYLTFHLPYATSVFMVEIYVLWEDPEEPSLGDLLAEYLCQAY